VRLALTDKETKMELLSILIDLVIGPMGAVIGLLLGLLLGSTGCIVYANRKSKKEQNTSQYLVE
jgi:hypothetical protein